MHLFGRKSTAQTSVRNIPEVVGKFDFRTLLEVQNYAADQVEIVL